MPVKNDREYRNFEMLKRAAQEGEEKDYIVEGYASTFDEYTLFNWGDGDGSSRSTRRLSTMLTSAMWSSCSITQVVFMPGQRMAQST